MPSRSELPAWGGYRVNCRQFRRFPWLGRSYRLNPSGGLPSRSGYLAAIAAAS
jgi:hypothetical protein